MNASPLIVAEGLKKHFPVRQRGALGKRAGLVKAVDGLDFRLERGRTLALVGESGCGKTTTARLILRLESPTEGRVLLDGENVHEARGQALRRCRRKMQAVFQDPWASLNPRMRVRDLIAEPLVINESPTRREVTRRVEKVLEEVGLRPEQAANYPHEFSGGQRQRIAVASALILRPELMVLDEPVSALDVSIRSQIMNLFKEIQDQHGISYLLIAHDLATTRYMADDIAVMYLGRIVERGPTEEVFRERLHPYTRALFSAALPSHPDAQTEEIILEGDVPSPLNPPSGCPFHTRCPVKIGRRCEEEVPVLREIVGGGPEHVASCHLLENAEPIRLNGNGKDGET